MDETQASTILEGIETGRRVAVETGLTLEFATVNPALYPKVKASEPDCPLMVIERRMLPPWRLKSMTDRAGRILKKDSDT
jgi:hypothetical protein